MVKKIMLEQTSGTHSLEWVHVGTVFGSLKGRGKKRANWLDVAQSIKGFEWKQMEGQYYFRAVKDF